ncbi:hypothetical protein PSH91_22665 [Pseudomonas sp. FP1154]|jgi:hypothetical protein|uniref:hypothetical protein n=1 Tax=Pseudomonas TaxID=286 RepID=UPI0009713C37|nr:MULTISPECIES: hypothetical protein [unclassified Pseudomonas]WLG22501.1 hypothetical protein PSH91_22665 [Pseudomonas sp. FP1154]
MDIQIDSPIRVAINLVEFDEHIHSIKFFVEIVVDKFEFSFSVSMGCWVECAVFDAFVDMLKRGRVARIEDMNNDFSLLVDVENKKLVWSCVKRDVAGNAIGAGGEEVLVDGAANRIKQAFESYPKWW